MNGKELKIILPIAVVAILVLSVLGIALMSEPTKDDPDEEETGPYLMSIGPILDDNGDPIEGAIIALKSGNETIASEVTNNKGYAGFSLEEKIDEGKYNMTVTKEGFDKNEFKVDLTYSNNNILIHSENLTENLNLKTKQLPPLEFTVGPIWGMENELLSGVAIDLFFKNTSIMVNYTNENGTASFSFETPPENGIYYLNISFEDYIQIEREIIVEYKEDTHTLSVIGNFDGMVLQKPLEPLELSIGPVMGDRKVLPGTSVEIIRSNITIAEENTDEYGIAKFIFSKPPRDSDYVIRITAKEYQVLDIEIVLKYNKIDHSLNITGDITDITLIPIEPPEPVDDPDYYKELDAVKELEGTDEEPVDVEGILDSDHNGEPEFYTEIIDATDDDVDVDQHVGLDDQGDPEYSPEIATYEALEVDPYLANQTRNPRDESVSNGNARSDWQEPSNLTHYDDIVDMNDILDNGTTEIMNYETDAANPTGVEGLTNEVADVGSLIANSLKVGFINGSNSTDANNDSRPEHLVIWKVVYLLQDRNGDNKTDKKIIAAQIFDLYDNNSNGVFEYSRGYQGLLRSFDNDYNGHFEDKTYAVAVGDEAKIDGNYTRHFKRVGVFYNRTLDKNNDSIYELQRAAMYIVHDFDNNSNGNFELHHEFAGGIESIDNNSNGKPESLLLVWGGNVRWQKLDNGVVSTNRTTMWIFSAKDKNEDGNPEDKWLLHHLKLSFDNNSNGNPEFKREVIAGFKVIDANSNGKDERVDALRAVGHTWDKNDDGTPDANVSRGHVFLLRDKNEDNNPEYMLALFYLEQHFDNNSNGNFEFTHKLIRGVLVNDPDSDGNVSELRAVHYGIITRDIFDNGNLTFSRSFAYAIHLKDQDSDSNLEYKRAVFGFERRWDNNTDGVYESVNQRASGYEGIDQNDDGQLDIERWFILTNRTIDKNNDGNPEFRQHMLMASLKVYNSTGTIIYGRNVVHKAIAFDNNSNGNFELVRYWLIGHVGYNGTPNGSKVDWETEKVLIIFTEFKDNDDNGTWDKINFWKFGKVF